MSRPVVFERTIRALPPAKDHDVTAILHVYADDDHHPVEHARAKVLAMVESRAYLAASGEADASGQLTLSSLPRTAVWILVDADGYARASTQKVLTGSDVVVNLALARAHRLDVTVMDDLGQPVPSADIEVSGGDPLPVGARTDTRGHGEVIRLAEPPWIVSVHAAGFEEVVRRGVREGEGPRIVLQKLGALRVTVKGPTGTPASLAHVQIAGSALWPARGADTGPDGTVRIGGLPAGSYALRATSGSAVSSTDLGIPLERGEERPVVLTLGPGIFAAVEVVDSDADDAAPVARARLTLVEGGLSPFPLEALTDESGAARLGPIAQGPAFLSVDAEGFVARGGVLAPDDGRTVTLVLARAGVVLGRVKDVRGRAIDGATIEIVGSSMTGAPIDDDPRKQSFRRAEFDATLGGPRALVPSGELGVVPGPVPPIPRVFDLPAAIPSSIRRAEEPWVTREDGTFRATPASPGRIRAIVRHPEYLEAMSEAVTLAPGGTVEVDVVLHAGGSLEGRVVDASGRPVAGATVVVAALRGSMERQTHSASDGTFAFAAVPEGVVVTASLGEDADPRTARATASVSEGGKASLILTLPDPRPALEVHVVDDRGYPVDAAQVSVGSVDPATPFRTTAFTDGHGTATIPGARGIALRLDVTAPGHASCKRELPAGDATAEVSLLPAETLTGSVRESRSGAPIKGAEIALHGEVTLWHTETLADGTWKLLDVAPGAARLRVRAKGRVTRERELTIAPGTAHRTDLGHTELDKEAVVEGSVLDGRGSPVLGARVGKDRVPTYVPSTSHDTSFAITGAGGRFRLGGLEEGAVTLEAYAPDVGRGRVSGVAVTAGRTTSGVTVRLVDEGEKASEPASAGGVAVTLGELAGDLTWVVLVGVADGSEAERAGLSAGDILVAVDGQAVHSIADARTRLSGPLVDDVVVKRRRGDVTESVRVPRESVRR